MCGRRSKRPFANSDCRWRSARTTGRHSPRPARAACRGSRCGGSSSACAPSGSIPASRSRTAATSACAATLKEAAVSPPAATLAEQQRRVDEFRAVYNHERPHEALDFATPASLYRASQRAYPCALREPDYPDEVAVRRVRSTGEIKWAGDLVFVSEALVGEPVAIEETDQGEWLVRYADVELGFIDKSGRLRRRKLPKPRPACGLVDNAARRPLGPQARQPQQQPTT
jgi:integrase-like protein